MSEIPHSPDAELGVLGGLVMERNLREMFIDRLVSSDFFSPPNQRAFSAICKLNDRGDSITNETLVAVGIDIALLVDVSSRAATVSEIFERDLALLKRDSARRSRLREIEIEAERIREDANCLTGGQDVERGIVRKSLFDLYHEQPDPEDTLLGDRWLCRGACLLLVAPTGVGKSSTSAQQDVAWTAGRPAFGIAPARPLRILTIQVENDQGDLGEMARGIVNGMELEADEIEALKENNRIVTMPGKVGPAFFEALDKELALFPCDILRIDPVTGFFGDEVKDSKAVNQFCREWLQPLLNKHRCGVILVLHTPKTNHRDTSDWKDHDWMYAGAGAADWSNFARAILIIEPKEYPVFQFKATKRKQRIGWKDVAGNQISDQYWAHSQQPGVIFWEPASASEVEATKKQRDKYDVQNLLVIGQEMSKKALVSKAGSIPIGQKKAEGFISELIGDGILKTVLKPRSKTNPEVFLERVL